MTVFRLGAFFGFSEVFLLFSTIRKVRSRSMKNCFKNGFDRLA